MEIPFCELKKRTWKWSWWSCEGVEVGGGPIYHRYLYYNCRGYIVFIMRKIYNSGACEPYL